MPLSFQQNHLEVSFYMPYFSPKVLIVLFKRYQNITLSPAESADVLLMLGRREEGGGVIPAPSDAPGVSLSFPAKRSDRYAGWLTDEIKQTCVHRE